MASIAVALADAGLEGPSPALGGGSAGLGTELRARRDAAWEARDAPQGCCPFRPHICSSSSSSQATRAGVT